MTADTGSMTAYDTLIDAMAEAIVKPLWDSDHNHRTKSELRALMGPALAAAEAATVPCTECGGVMQERVCYERGHLPANLILDESQPEPTKHFHLEHCSACTDGRRSALDVHRERKP